MSLCRKRTKSAPESRQPSTIEAWLSLSQVTTPGQRSDAVRAGAVLVTRSLASPVDPGVADQPEVAVRGEHQHLASAGAHARAASQFLDGLVVKVIVHLLALIHAGAHKPHLRGDLVLDFQNPCHCVPLPPV